MRRICLAEETEELGLALSEFLGSRGYDVHVFRDGEDAWEFLVLTPPDLLIVSRELPGLGGLDLLALVSSGGFRIPTIFMTAAGSESIAADALNLGAVCYLIKSTAEEMCGPLEKALDRACHQIDLERENERLIAELLRQNDRLEATVAARTAELRRINEELQGLDRMKSAFITLMSHEIRTPLTSILGFSELIGQGICEDSEERRSVAEQIRTAGKSLCHFVDDVMELFRWLSGSRSLAKEPVRLEAVVRSALDLVAEKARIKSVRFDLRSEGEPELRGDEIELVRAVHRILDNAVKFSRPGGAVELLLSGNESGCDLQVIDHGEGIDPEHRAAIFRPLEIAGKIENHSQGRGLGLTLVLQAVRAHGGEITVESAGIGRGTTVRLHLPAAGTTTPASRLDLASA